MTGDRIRGDYAVQMSTLSLALLSLILLLSLTLSGRFVARAEVRI